MAGEKAQEASARAVGWSKEDGGGLLATAATATATTGAPAAAAAAEEQKEQAEQNEKDRSPHEHDDGGSENLSGRTRVGRIGGDHQMKEMLVVEGQSRVDDEKDTD